MFARAQGILMARLGLTQAQAIDRLTKAAAAMGVSLSVAAAIVINTPLPDGHPLQQEAPRSSA